jgi:imidazoleglycerol phosphate dehydratase HisB
MEAVFKAFALSLDEATSLDERRKEIPSTKKRID